MFRTSAMILTAALAVGASTARAEIQKPRAVVELFTSQGCSSCPPADRLAAELARDPNLIVLSMPVDYWDYLGWKDTLASPACTQRQRAYSLERGDRQVYTPQMIINGQQHLVGSDRSRVMSATSGSITPMPLSLERAEAGLKLGIPADPGKSGMVMLVRVTKAKTVAIGRGENSGASVTYTNVVHGMTKLGDWHGAAESFTIPASALNAGEGEGFVILVQSGSEGHPGEILAAAKGPGM